MSSQDRPELEVALGLALVSSDQEQAGLRLLESVVILLPERPSRLAAGAFNAMVLGYLRLGNLEEARRAINTARSCVDPRDSYSQGLLDQAEGTWQRMVGKSSQGALCFERAFELLAPINPIDAALALLNLVEARLEDGSPLDAASISDQAIHLVNALDSNRRLAEVLQRFRQVVLCGRASLEIVERCREGLAGGRNRSLRPPIDS